MSITQRCKWCGKSKILETNFNKNKFTENNYSIICKSCRSKISTKDEFILYLKDNNIEFEDRTWEKAEKSIIEELKKKNKGELPSENKIIKKIINKYMSLINLRGSYQATTRKKYTINNDEEKPKELVDKWGTEFDINTLNELERLYEEMLLSFRIESASQKDYLKKICIASVMGEKELKNGNIDKADKWIKMYDNLMKSSKMAPVQSSPTDALGVNTFGQFVEVIEKHGFIPKYPDVPQDDIDVAILSFINYNRKLINLNSIDLEDLKTELSDINDATE